MGLNWERNRKLIDNQIKRLTVSLSVNSKRHRKHRFNVGLGMRCNGAVVQPQDLL